MSEMGNVGEAFIKIRPNTTAFAADAERGVVGQMSSLARKAAGLLAGAFVVKEGFSFVQGAIAAGREANKVQAQTAAVLLSTAGAAKINQTAIVALADSISRKTGIDDEAIQASENLLLTFTRVRNEAGKGNDIFNQATVAVTDMSKALGQDGKTSAIQLGKALNDPIKGVMALTRVGVTFSQQQKDQIKALVDSGNTLGAQKVILKELTTEFGGSAAAQATAGQKLGVVWENVKERLGKALIPVLDKVAAFLSDRLPAAADMVSGAFAVTGRAIKSLVDKIGPTIAQIAGQVTAFFKTLRTGFTEDEGTPVERFALILRNDLLPALRKVASFVADNLRPALIALGVVLVGPAVVGAISTTVLMSGALYAAFVAAGGGAAGLGAVLAALFSPVTLIVAAVAAVGFAVFYAYRHFTGFRQVVNGVARFLRDDFLAVVTKVADVIGSALGPVVAFLGGQFSRLLAGLGGQLGAVKEAVGHIFHALVVVVKGALIAIGVAVAVLLAPIIVIFLLFGRQILDAVKIAWHLVSVVIETAVRVVLDIVKFVLALINGEWGAAWKAISDIPKALLGLVAAVVDGAMKILLSILTQGVHLLGVAFKAGLEVLSTVVGVVIGAVVDFFTALPGRVLAALAALPGMLLKAAGTMIGLMIVGLVTAAVLFFKFWTDLVPDTLKKIANFGADLAKKAVSAVGDMVGGLVSAVPKVLSFFSELPGKAVNALIALGQFERKLLGSAKDAIVSMVRGLVGAVPDVLSFFSELPGKAVKALGNVGSTLLGVGKSLIQGLVDGLKAAAHLVIKAIQDTIINKLPGFVKKALGINSPSTLFHGFGVNLMEGLALGIRSGASGVQDVLGRVAGSLSIGGGGLRGLLSAGLSGSASFTLAPVFHQDIRVGSGADVAAVAGAVKEGTAGGFDALLKALKAGVGSVS